MRALSRGTAVALGIGLLLVACWVLPAVLLGGDGRPVWFFVALLPLYLFPWSLHLGFWRSAMELRPGDLAVRFVAIQALSALAVFSLIASKQAHYLIPELPGLAILIALAVAGRPWGRFDNLGAAMVAAGAVLVLAILVISPGQDWQSRHLSWGAAVLLFVIVVSGLALWRRSVQSTAIWSVALVLAANLWIADAPLRDAHDMRSFVAHVDGREGREIAYFGREYNAEFNFAGRLATDVAVPADLDALQGWLRSHPSALSSRP